MGLIGKVLGGLFVGQRNVLAETAEVFRVNAEAADARDARQKTATLAQFNSEFSRANKGLFDRVIDGVNRLPRPAMALGTIGLFVSAMANPDWFAERMRGVALVPEPLWWLLGVIVSFYFGARHQVKGQQFQTQIARAMVQLPVTGRKERQDQVQTADSPLTADTSTDSTLSMAAVTPGRNAALDEWRHEPPR